MGNCLANHRAGDQILIDDNEIFRRETDKFIKAKVGKTPLDIGADKIARTAYAALKIIHELSDLVQFNIQLTWNTEVLRNISVIEVYPAATLGCRGIQNLKYKDKGKDPIKEEIVDSLKQYLKLPNDLKLILSNADVLDSVVCTLAAKDFLDGNAYQPIDKELAKKEGWIWVYGNVDE